MANNTYNIEIKNMDNLVKAIQEYPKIAEARLITAINKALAILARSGTQDVFQFKTPSEQRTHYLEATWGAPGKGLKLARPGDLTGAIFSNARYAIFVHEGTKAHIIRAVNKQVLANKKTGQVFGKVVHHPGTQPNRFLPRIIQKGRSEIQNVFQNALSGILGDIANQTNTI